MPAWTKVLPDWTTRGKKALGVTSAFEAAQRILPLARGLVGILGAGVQKAGLAMFHTGQHLPLGGSITPEFVRDDAPWYIVAARQQLAEEFLGRRFVPLALHKNIQDGAVLINSAPELVRLAIDRDKHFIQMPRVARLWAALAQLVRIDLAKFEAPLADGFVGDDDATLCQEFFHVTEA